MGEPGAAARVVAVRAAVTGAARAGAATTAATVGAALHLGDMVAAKVVILAGAA